MTFRETLVGPDPWIGWHGGIQPELAESWDVSADGLTYTFHLRKGVFFRSVSQYDKPEFAGMPGRGKELICEDVQAFGEFAGTDRWWAEGGAISKLIDTAVHTWSCPDGPKGYTVVVTLDSGIPNPGLLEMLSQPGAWGIPPKEWSEWVLGKYPTLWMRTGEWTTHVGTGGFIPKAHSPELVSKTERNPNYWKPGLPFVDNFEFHTIPDPATAFAAWATGKVDIMGHGSGSMYPAQVKQALRTLPDKPMYANHYFGARAAGFNTQRPPFDDVRVRKAVHLVQDRQQWLALESTGDGRYASLTAGFFNALGQPYNPMGATLEEILTWPGFRQPRDQDIAEANRLMDEVYGKGVRPGPLKCLTRADDTSTNNCLFTGEMMAKHLGWAGLTLDLYDAATLTNLYAGCTWTIGPTVVPGWDFSPDPYERYRAFNSELKGFRTCMGGVDPALQTRLNKLINNMQRELDFTKRTAISKEIEYLIYNDLVIAAPIGWQNLFTGGQPWLKGYRVPDHAIHSMHVTAIQRAWLTK
jgi:ABC-type transport system substrate-binding protein